MTSIADNITTTTTAVRAATSRHDRGLRVRADGVRPVIEYNAAPVTLRTATEHYGSVLNRAFDFRGYLEMLASTGCNLTRTFVLFRELQSATNPSSTCKPESLNYLAPYARSSPSVDEPRALDGQPKFDLDRWDPEFFERLHEFCSLADSLGVVIELTMLSNTYGESIWQLNPLHPDNHVSGHRAVVGPISWPEYLCERHETLLARQEELVTKIVTECSGYPAVIFELCNEPGGDAPPSAGIDLVSVAEVNRWLRRLTAVIRSTDGGRHLVAGQPAFRYEPWQQSVDLAFPIGRRRDTADAVAVAVAANDNADADEPVDVDVINVHPLPGTVLQGQTYDLGRFMNGDLAAEQVTAFCRAAAQCGTPVNLDEDNAATQYTNPFGWSLHRRRAWLAALHGCHYDMIDFTIRPGVPWEPDSPLRQWTRVLGNACDEWHLCLATPVDDWRVADPEQRCRVVVVRPGKAAEHTYLAYVHDITETTSWTDPLAAAAASLHPAVPAGRYRITCVDPVDGTQHPAQIIQLSSGDAVPLPSFADDLLVVITPDQPIPQAHPE